MSPGSSVERGQALAMAEALAQALVRDQGPGRTELRPVLAALFLGTEPWARRLELGRRLVALLPHTWMAGRSEVSPQKLRRVQQVLTPFLAASPDEATARLVLGWCAQRARTLRG